MYSVPNPDIWVFAPDELQVISEEEYQRSRAEGAANAESTRARGLQITGKLWREPIKTFLETEAFRDLQDNGIPWPAPGYLLHLWCDEWGAPISARLPHDARRAIEPERKAWMECCRTGILPIGADSIVNLRVHDSPAARGERFARLWAPFEGDVYTNCIVRARFGRTTCHAFRLVVPVHADDGDPYAAWRSTGEVRFYVAGDPDSEHLNCWRDAVREWVAGSREEQFARGPGRPRKEIPFPLAQATYWSLCEQFEAAGERRKPSTPEVCDHLAAQGLTVGKTTFGEHVKEWRKQGFTWPPPLPDIA